MTTFNRDAHVLDGEDRGRIDCCRCDEYATMCEHLKLYTGSVAFYYYCSACWHTPGPNAPSPAERTGLPAPGVACEVCRRESCKGHGRVAPPGMRPPARSRRQRRAP